MIAPLRLLMILLILSPLPVLAATRCPVPEDILPEAPALPNTVKALESGRPLCIAALGGASTAGNGLQSAAQAFPNRLAERMREKFKGADIRVVNKGRAGENTRTMVDAIGKQILPEHPSLVLWEAGTMEAAGGADPYQMAEGLRRGVEKLRASGTDVILIDMQYSPAAAALINFTPYLAALRVTAESTDAPLFQRYAAMRAWTQAGEIDLDGDPPDQRGAQATQTEDCVAAALAEIVEKAVRLSQPKAP